MIRSPHRCKRNQCLMNRRLSTSISGKHRPENHPNSGLPEFGTLKSWPKSDISDFGWGDVASAGCPAIGERTPCRLRATVDTNSYSAAGAPPPTAIAATAMAARKKFELVSSGIAIAVSIDTDASQRVPVSKSENCQDCDRHSGLMFAASMIGRHLSISAL